MGLTKKPVVSQMGVTKKSILSRISSFRKEEYPGEVVGEYIILSFTVK